MCDFKSQHHGYRNGHFFLGSMINFTNSSGGIGWANVVLHLCNNFDILGKAIIDSNLSLHFEDDSFIFLKMIVL